MNFRKIAAASAGRLLLRYFTESTPEPILGRAVEAGRSSRKADVGTRREARGLATGHAGDWKAIGIDEQMPRREMARLLRRAGLTTARPGPLTPQAVRGGPGVTRPVRHSRGRGGELGRERDGACRG